MKYRILFMILMSLFVSMNIVHAQPGIGHIVWGIVKNPDGSTPDSAEVEFYAFLNKAPENVTEKKYCSGEGGWAINVVHDIPNSTWSVGDIITVIFKNVGGSEFNGEEFNLVYQTTVSSPELVLEPIVLPVELVTFRAESVSGVTADEVHLKWSTATETNNYGFSIERSQDGIHFESVGFVAGAGSCNIMCEYKFIDKEVEIGGYTYRLKQIDTNGKFSYSGTVQIDVAAPKTYSLSQNFPNPFNPTTDIIFRVKQDGRVRITVFDILGREVMRLVDGQMKAGTHRITVDGHRLPSGMYLYRMEAADFNQVKKMALVK
jgi:hypothetical protein